MAAYICASARAKTARSGPSPVQVAKPRDALGGGGAGTRRGVERRQDPPHQGVRRLRAGRRQEDDELVAADPRDGAAARSVLGEKIAEPPDQGVAGLVAPAVVGGLQPVEVDHDHRDRHGPVGLEPVELGLVAGAVEEAGEGIGEAQGLEADLLPLVVADIGERDLDEAAGPGGRRTTPS
ncbi:hypothetical protein NS228_00120 [Methylobacterium indicum]|nr:hypothetical protein [Methylobacterium indicum]KTS37584.1 hypothetical protein NS229_06685 [Methylobacterium indicum]KTS43103.1 hypothetical protein NS228_00120 [Methylobacterium indicum]KTS54519.1 hypothetical protein NS230_01440 [Methylobacterium indicum]